MSKPYLLKSIRYHIRDDEAITITKSNFTQDDLYNVVHETAYGDLSVAIYTLYGIKDKFGIDFKNDLTKIERNVKIKTII